MNILFLSLLDFDTFDDRNIYTDLLREFIKRGHKVCCITPIEKRKKQDERVLEFDENCILKLRIGNTQKVNVIEKGISTLLIEPLFIKGIKRYFSDVKFDLVLYATPPVTFAKVIRFVKKRDNAKSYLMLKDIFPQNAIDLGMLSKTGVKGIIYKYFRHKEKQLYANSDIIGCMSQANVDYILKHNPEISKEKVEICPNSIEPVDMRVSEEEKREIRRKYELPLDKTIFVYGGNLGRPQDVPYIVECLKACKDIESIYFIIAGGGTDRHFFTEYMESERPSRVKLFDNIPKAEYDKMIACCDVGLIFLDHRFTIPNFPSRLLSYMQAGLPVLACTDVNTDIGQVITEGEFGWWHESNDIEAFVKTVSHIGNVNLTELGQKAYSYLENNFSTEMSYNSMRQNF